LLQISARELNALDLHPVLQADMEIALRDLRPDLLLEMDRLQPTGAENPEAAFVSRGLRTVRWRTVGADRKHLKITLTDGKVVFDGIAFRQGHWAEAMPDRIDVLYNFERNFYNGRESLQLNIRDIHPANGSH
jgi:single-stranded-DNA-specific exonuclease